MTPKYDIRLIEYQGLESSLQQANLSGDFGLVIQVDPFPRKQDESMVISVQHTNLLSKLYHDLKSVIYDAASLQRTIFLNLSDELENFDINFIGVLTLFKTQFPSIQFTVRLPGAGGYSAYARFRDSFFRIRTVYESISGIRPFEIADELVLKGRARETIDPMLIFPINPETFQRYFVDTRGTLESAELMKSVDSERLFGFIRKQETAKGTAAENNYRKTRKLIGHFSDSIDWGNTNEIFFLEYCRMLSEFNLLQPNIELIRPGVGKGIGFKSFTKKGFKDFEMNQLATGAKKIFDGLQGEPSYFTFLFSFLVNRNIGTMVVKDDEGEDGSLLLKQNLLLDRLKELLAFTRNLFLSIRELARNIIDHTEHRRGVITGRVYQGIHLRSIKDDSELKSGVETYLLEMDQEDGAASAPSAYFDLSIFDEGSAGMIEKTISNINNLAKGITVDSDLYTSDIELLEDGSVNIGDFFNAGEIKLNHNAIKTASHWGLIIFGSLIKKNGGFYKVQTKGRAGGLDTYYSGPLNSNFSHVAQESRSFTGGTIFNVILPLDRTQGLKEQVVQTREVKDNDFSAKNYYELLKYRFLESDHQLKKGDRDVLTRLDISSYTGAASMMDYRAEIAVADKLGARVTELRKICEEQIFVLDFEDCADSFDQSRLLRFLARLQLQHNLHDIIVFNIHAGDLIPLRALADEESVEFDARSFWDPGHFVLIYSYIRNKDKRNYFTDILGGFRYADLKKLRNKLSYTHHTNFDIGNSDNQGGYSVETLEGIASSKLFRSGTSGIVQNFELVLKLGNKTVFEISLENLLNEDVFTGEGQSSGYKIGNTHFRLGSKTHISEFVYAKRIFQNSFYSDRFAFLIAKYISESCPDIGNTTVIGYGDYAQLLINRTTVILKKVLGFEFNNDIITDTEQYKLLKQTELLDNVIILVPINTTFSTSVKIENFIRGQKSFKEEGRLETVNLILVTHKDFADPRYVEKLNTVLLDVSPCNTREYPYKLFNWKYVDIEKRIVEVETNPPTPRMTSQKYFITVPSRWSLPDECEQCFPSLRENAADLSIDYRLLEKPLLETDKSSVTPDLLLEIPRNFEPISSISLYVPEKPVFLNEEALTSGHLSKWNNHYIHFIDPQIFFEHYRDEISKWAESCKKKLLEADPDIMEKSILLISSNRNINAYFIEYINRKIFQDAAIINHYEIGEDYIENFEKFFSHDIRQAKYIFFVDDFVHSGKTFHLINDFVRHCSSNEQQSGIKKARSCDGVFTLINKADNYCLRDIADLLYSEDRKESWLFSFFSWKDIHTAVENCPVCRERERYARLADSSMLDTVRHFFLNKVKNLSLYHGEPQKNTEQWKKYNPLIVEDGHLPWEAGSMLSSKELYDTYSKGRFPSKNYLKMLVQHYVNELLSSDMKVRNVFMDTVLDNDEKRNIQSTTGLIDDFMEKLMGLQPFSQWLTEWNGSTKELFETLFREVAIKTLTQQPFKNIKPVREKIFAWLLIELTEKIDLFKKSERLDFKMFRYIKFLMRRATLLGSNFIIDRKTLEDFRDIYKKYYDSNSEAVEINRKEKFLRLEEKLSEIFRLIKSATDRIDLIPALIENARLELFELEGDVSSLVSNEKMAQLSVAKNTIGDLETEYAQLLMEVKEMKLRERYIGEVKRNLIYKDVSVKEFSYFYVSLIKELTLSRENKVVMIERNVNEIFDQVKESGERQFYFLLRLVKLENVSVLREFLNVISHTAQGEKISFKKKCYQFRSEIKRQIAEAFSNYKLSAIRQFLQIDNLDNWLESESANWFIHLVYLHKSLAVENGESQSDDPITGISMASKSEGILRNIYRMVADPHFKTHDYLNYSDNPYEKEPYGNGAYLALRYRDSDGRGIAPKDIAISNAFVSGEYVPGASDEEKRNLKQNKLLETSIDYNSMAYLMLNGVSGTHMLDGGDLPDGLKEIHADYPLKPWTVLELCYDKEKDPGFWDVPRGPIYRIGKIPDGSDSIFNGRPESPALKIARYFNEFSVIDNSSRYMMFLRIAGLDYHQQDEVYNQGKAVIGFFSNQGEISVDRMRLLLLVSRNLNRFFEDHYEQDSLVAFMDERARNIEATRLKHGYLKFLATYNNIALNKETPEPFRSQTLRLFRNQLEVGPILANKFSAIKSRGVKAMHLELSKDFVFSNYTSESLINLIEEVFNVVYCNRFVTAVANVTPIINSTVEQDDFQFSFYDKILRLLLTELFTNMKIAQANFDKEYLKVVKISLSFHQAVLCIKLENNYVKSIPDGEKYRICLGNFSLSPRGLGLISQICETFGGSKPVISVDDDNKNFSMNINLKSYDSN